MIPIDPLISAPRKVFNKLHIDHTKTETFFKKAAKYLHNGTLPFFCTAIVTIACITGAILAGVINVLTAPFVGIYQQLSEDPTQPPSQTEFFIIQAGNKYIPKPTQHSTPSTETQKLEK